MSVQHSAITDPNIHEPKGVASASSGAIYVANGSGSGVWTNRNTLFATPAYASMAMAANGVGTGIPDAESYEKVAGTFTAGPLFGATFNSNELTITAAGVYLVNYRGAVVNSDVADQTYLFSVGINGTASQFGPTPVLAETDIVERFSYSAILSVPAGGVLYPMVTNPDNDNKGCTVTNLHFVVTALRNT